MSAADDVGRVRELAARHGLAAWADTMVASLAPALRLRKLPSRSAGLSRLGGPPAWPAGTAWPQKGEQPLTLLAQIDCGAATAVSPHLGLPDRGILQFF